MDTSFYIIAQITEYITSLDWGYIITFIILGFGINHYCLQRSAKTGVRKRSRYRIALVGLIYGVILYFIRSSPVKEIERLLQSFIFSIVFHKLVVESLLYWLIRKGLPEQISKTFFDDEQLKRIGNAQ